MQGFVSTVFGFNLLNNWSSDFGVYFVGSYSISNTYPLYEGFFDHKGPLYYAFINVLGHFVPYSPLGAALTLTFTCIFFFLCVNIGNNLMKFDVTTKTVVNLISTSILWQQTGNASIAIFQSAFIYLSYASFAQYLKNGRQKAFTASVILAFLASLVRFDSISALFSIFCIGVYFGKKKKLKFDKVSLLLLPILCLGFIYLLSTYLYFSIETWWTNAIVFNLTTYRQWYGEYNEIQGVNFHSQLFSFPGRPYLVLILANVLMFFYATKLRETWFLIGLTIAPFIMFASIANPRDYHLLILFPSLLILLGHFLNYLVKTSKIKIAYSILSLVSIIFISIFSYRSFFVNACKFELTFRCPNVFLSLSNEDTVALESQSEFWINQGWPYLFSGRKPSSNFTPYFPAKYNIGKASQELKTEILSKRYRYIWVEESSSILNGITLKSLNVDFEKLYERSDFTIGQYVLFELR